MPKKLYYWILFIASSLLVLLILNTIFIFSFLGFHYHKLEPFKNALVLLILYVQTSFAPPLIRWIVAVLSFFAAVGYIFAFEHYFNAKELFLGSAGLIILLLIREAFRQRSERGIYLSILTFPTIHLIVIAGYIYRLSFPLWSLDLLAMGFLAIRMGREIFGR